MTEYLCDAYHYVFYWDADPEIKEIRKPELDGYIRHRLSLFEPTGFYLDDVILGPAKQPTEGKVFGDVIEECLTAFFLGVLSGRRIYAKSRVLRGVRGE